MIDLKNYIIESIKSYNSDIDTREGSNFRDILINPLSQLLESYQQDHEAILSRLNVSNIEDLSEQELDAIAANFLIERNTGTIATGKIQLYFNSPIGLTIPRNTRFETEAGTVIETTSDYAITKLQMELNTANFPLYTTGELSVRAVEPGQSGNLAINTPLQPTTNLTATPERTVVSEELTGGANGESNSQFYQRIQNTVFNKTLASPTAIKDRIKDQVSTIVDSEVIGAGHPLMLRDLTSFYGSQGEYQSEDFNYVYSGMQADPYSKQHEAYAQPFRDSNPGEDVDFPTITGWTQEFTDDMYKGLYQRDDVLYASLDQYALINEDFSESIDYFQKNDGRHPEQELYHNDEIRLEGETLKLGLQVDPNSNTSAISLTDSQLEDIEQDLKSGNVSNAIENIKSLRAPEQFNNLSPVLHKAIDFHAGIEIEVEMSTTDTTENGEMAYVTVLRNDQYFAAHDGFGIAWRKQPDFLVRMENSEHTQEDLDKFEEEYGLDPTSYIGNISSNSDLWKYNVYLVDNDILQEEVFVGTNQMVTQTSGANQFLASKKVWIEEDIDYYFRIKIYENFAVEAWVHEVGSAPGSYTSGNTTISLGSQYPNFIPSAGETITRTLSGGEQVNYTRGHFGIGVGETRNNEWTVDNLFVRSFIQTFPMHLFKFEIDQTEWSVSDPFNIYYYGVGLDPSLYSQDGSGHSKTKAAVWDPNLTQWELIGTHEATIDDTRSDQLITAELNPLNNYIDGDGFVNIAATAANTGSSFPNDVDHDLRTYYVSIDNGGSELIHRGNAIDVYCHDPTNYKTGRVTHTLSSQNVETNDISGFPGFIHEIIEIREYVSGTVIGPSTYEIFAVDKGEAFSASGNYKISFDDGNIGGTIIEITYRYWASGSAVDSFLLSEDNRYPAVDILSKVMPPAIITVNQLEFSGNLTESRARQLIVDYFNSLTERSFDKSDLIDLLYDNGANYVNLDIDIDIKQYRNDFSYLQNSLEGQTYTIPFNVTGRFYTEINLLEGVTIV